MKRSPIKRLIDAIFPPKIRVYIVHYYCDICGSSPCGAWDYEEVVPGLKINEHIHMETCLDCESGKSDFDLIHTAKHFKGNRSYRFTPYEL